ncbi:MAG TPA: hypothetical protein DCM27_06870 [Rhodospirillaceae bacterium]|nr:hypothetical protein [Rhodospirillaceae bacterium]
MAKDLKSICLVIRHDQYDRLQDMDINVSGFIRDIIDDRLSEHTITVNVTPETRMLYNQIVSTSPQGDSNIEPYLRDALKRLLQDRIEEMKSLQKSLK